MDSNKTDDSSNFLILPSQQTTSSSQQNDSTTTKQQNSNDTMKIFCFNISKLTRSAQFFILTFLTFFYYLVYGYLLELVYRFPNFSLYSWYFTLVQFLFYTLFAFIESYVRRELHRNMPLSSYVLLAFLTVVTMGLSNTSLGYLNYPTQVMFKCCKLIPVLIGGIIIQGKRHNLFDVLATICMTIGLIFFTLADQKVQPDFKLLGVILISGALCADAAIGNVQEKQMKKYKASNFEVVLYSYGFGSVYIFVGELLFDNIGEAIDFWSRHPVETYGYTLILSLSGYLGINIVLLLVKSFGALCAVTVTTSRKAITIILSFMFFAKPFTFQYLWSGVLVVIGIYFNVFSKNQDKIIDSLLNSVKRLTSSSSTNKQNKYQTISTEMV